jgi:hypothetical protein
VTSKLLLALFCVVNAAGADLQIQILQGTGVNSRMGSRGQSFVLRVADASGKPVADSTVIFSAPAEGPSLNFGDGPIVQTSTDSSGTASTPLARPVGGAGPVHVEVLAEKNGKSANIVIDQMNVAAVAGETADLEIAVMPPPQSSHSGGKRPLRLRVTDERGAAVVGAHVSITFFASGSKQSLPDMQADSAADGIAEFNIDARMLKGQVLVRAATDRVTSSRMTDLTAP